MRGARARRTGVSRVCSCSHEAPRPHPRALVPIVATSSSGPGYSMKRAWQGGFSRTSHGWTRHRTALRHGLFRHTTSSLACVAECVGIVRRGRFVELEPAPAPRARHLRAVPLIERGIHGVGWSSALQRETMAARWRKLESAMIFMKSESRALRRRQLEHARRRRPSARSILTDRMRRKCIAGVSSQRQHATRARHVAEMPFDFLCFLATTDAQRHYARHLLGNERRAAPAGAASFRKLFSCVPNDSMHLSSVPRPLAAGSRS